MPTKKENVCKCNNCGNTINKKDFKTQSGCCSNNCAILYARKRNGDWCGDWDDPRARINWG